MPLPTLTEEQRQDALAKAAEARRRRAELKAQLKAEKVSLRDVLAKQGDDVVGKMKVSSVLESLPGWEGSRPKDHGGIGDLDQPPGSRPGRQAEGQPPGKFGGS